LIKSTYKLIKDGELRAGRYIYSVSKWICVLNYFYLAKYILVALKG